jgi:hypothetical protein
MRSELSLYGLLAESFGVLGWIAVMRRNLRPTIAPDFLLDRPGSKFSSPRWLKELRACRLIIPDA